MSRIGKKPIAVPAGVTATVESGTLTVKGPKGQLAMQLLDDLVKYEVAEGEIRVTPLTDAQRNRAAWGRHDDRAEAVADARKLAGGRVHTAARLGYPGQMLDRRLALEILELDADAFLARERFF